ncbi:MAG TPA: hypothetical protein VH987_04905 [Candidatus Limnocylindria bacterium]
MTDYRDPNAFVDNPEIRKWMGEHLDELRSNVTEHRYRTQFIWAGIVAGLLAHVGGYLLRSAALAEPFGLLADLMYALGLALWTGTVVVVLTEIIPQLKERQVLSAIDAYEAAVQRGDTQSGGSSGTP